MALTQLAPPYPIFTDKSGSPLDNGYLYFGEVNKNPETNPIQVYYDSAFTQPAAQPLRTSNGYVMRNGSPALIYAGSQFSVTVRDKNNALVIYSPVGYGIDPGSITGSVVYDDFTGDGVTVNFTISASPSTKNATNVYIDGVYQSKDNYEVGASTLTFSTAPPINSAIEVVTQESSIIGGASSQQITYTQGGSGSVTRTVQSRLRDFVSVKDFGAVGDGVTDDSAAFQAAQSVITTKGGGCIWVPYTSAGYMIGDGTNSIAASTDSGIVVTSNTHWLGENKVKLIVGSKTANGNYLFELSGCNNVVIDGFTCDGQAVAQTDRPYVAVSLRQIVTNAVIKNLHCYDFANFAIQYADADTSPASAYFANVIVDNVRINGVTGVTGAGSGINFFPRSASSNLPASKNLTITNCDIDVSNGSTDCNDHGPQCIKVNNVDGVHISNVTLRGGEVFNMTLTNGVRNAYVDGVGTLSDLGFDISTFSNVVGTRTSNIVIGSWIYKLDGATNSSGVGFRLKGAVHNFLANSINLTGCDALIGNNYANDIALPDGEGADLRGIVFSDVRIQDGSFRVDDATSASQPNLDSLVVDNLFVFGTAGGSSGRLDLDTSNWLVTNCHFKSLSFEGTDNDCVTCNGSNNVFEFISVKDGNPDNDANAWVINDIGSGNTYRRVDVYGSSNNMDFFVNKSGGSGIKLEEFSGSVSDVNGVRFVNQEAADPIMGKVSVVSKNFDLSGAADEDIIFYADSGYYIASVMVLYTEATSADAGINLQLGDNDAAAEFLTMPTTTNAAVGDVDLYQNTTGTAPTFGDRDLVKGDFLKVTCAGGKTGTGEAKVIVNLIQKVN